MATVLERPVAGLCEPQLELAVVEHRAANRSPDNWEQSGKNMIRSYKGHALMVEPLMSNGRCIGWFKWLDHHYRGVENGMANAERDLENEAERVRSAWAKRRAWEVTGAPDRRAPR